MIKELIRKKLSLFVGPHAGNNHERSCIYRLKEIMLDNMTGKPASMVSASVLTLACATGCGSQPIENNQGTIPSNTQLALSPNGKRLVVSWYDQKKKLHAKLVELNGAAVASMRDIALPPSTFTTEFANNNEQLLATTNINGASELIKISIDSDAQTLIYKSAFTLRFPLEISDGSYVFLEGEPAKDGDPANRWKYWQKYQNDRKIRLNDQPFGMAAPLNVIGDSLFVFTPARTFLAIQGTVPERLLLLIRSDTWDITCADKTALTCIHNAVRYESGRYLATISIFNDQHRCNIVGKWLDIRQLEISRDGSTVVFHAALQELNGPRAIYVVKNTNISCPINSMPMEAK